MHVSHTTIMRWVHRYVPEYEARRNCRAKPVGSSWRMDETHIQTRPKTGSAATAIRRSISKAGQGLAQVSFFSPIVVLTSYYLRGEPQRYANAGWQ